MHCMGCSDAQLQTKHSAHLHVLRRSSLPSGLNTWCCKGLEPISLLMSAASCVSPAGMNDAHALQFGSQVPSYMAYLGQGPAFQMSKSTPQEPDVYLSNVRTQCAQRDPPRT